MDLEVKSVKKLTINEIITKYKAGEFKTQPKKNIKSNSENLKYGIETDDYILARNSAFIGICLNDDVDDKIFEFIRKSGLFRYSKYIKKKCIVQNLAKDTLEFCNTISYKNQANLNYLDSIINFYPVLNSYNEAVKTIINLIRKFKKDYPEYSLIKTLLSYTDNLFLKNFHPLKRLDYLDISTRPREDIASAVSYLIFLLHEGGFIDKYETRFASVPYMKTSEFYQLLGLSCFISDFRDFEIQIDFFNYQCIKLKDKLKIIPPYDEFERSIRLGYIRSDIQMYNDAGKIGKAISFYELIDKIYSIEKLEIFQYTRTYDFPRYRIEIPEPILQKVIEDFIEPNSLFQEEIQYLSFVFKEQMLDFDKLFEIKIKPNLTLIELFKIVRVFSFFYYLFHQKVKTLGEEKNEIILSSLVPTYTEADLFYLLKPLVSEDKIKSFLEILSWNPASKRVFDIQYHPILKILDIYLIPLGIFATANIIRNSYASEYKGNNPLLLTDGDQDPVSLSLKESFDNVNIYCQLETNIPDGDIDVFAIFENKLFIFECKQSLHPVSPFDLRTIHDYIKKAEKQLDNILKSYHDGSLNKILINLYSINLDLIEEIVPCIVLSNRLFNGDAFKYPIRYINEITNFIENGTIVISEGKYRLWKNITFSSEDLKEYCSKDYFLVKHFFENLSVETIECKLIEPPLEHDLYYLNLLEASPKLNELVKNRLVKVE